MPAKQCHFNCACPELRQLFPFSDIVKEICCLFNEPLLCCGYTTICRFINELLLLFFSNKNNSSYLNPGVVSTIIIVTHVKTICWFDISAITVKIKQKWLAVNNRTSFIYSKGKKSVNLFDWLDQWKQTWRISNW